mgnify:CR=1 FL=1
MPRRSFLDRLEPADRAALEAAWQIRRYGAGETVLVEGDAERDVYVLLEGRATASVHSADGRLLAYSDIHEGELFGELAAIDRLPRSADLVAVTPLVAGHLTAARFRRLVHATPGLAWALLEHMAIRLRHTNRRVFEVSTMVVRERLVCELVRQAEQAGGSTGRVALAPAPTHRELAARISTHREAVSREMSRLAREGLIGKEDGALVVEDLARLRALQDMMEEGGA